MVHIDYPYPFLIGDVIVIGGELPPLREKAEEFVWWTKAHHQSLSALLPVEGESEGGERKFLVLETLPPQISPEIMRLTGYHHVTWLTLVIGPKLEKEDSYYHQQLAYLAPVKSKNSQIMGGGKFNSYRDADGKLRMEFFGKSGTFGAFTPKLFLQKDFLQTSLRTCLEREIEVLVERR